MDDGARPHQFPERAPAEVLAWVCQACGELIREFGPRQDTPCPINWRNE